MKNADDIQAYLMRSGMTHQDLGEGTWLVRLDPDHDPAVIRLEGPVVLLRADVGQAPAKGREAFFAQLLKEKAEALVHCSYGLFGEKVVISAALPIENLDYNEFIMTLDDMSMALGRDLVGAAKG